MLLDKNRNKPILHCSITKKEVEQLKMRSEISEEKLNLTKLTKFN